MDKLTTITLLASLLIAGKYCEEGASVEVSEKDAKELINRGVATDDVEVGIDEISFVEMTLAELGEVEYKKLNRDHLVEFATACELDVDGLNMKDIVALIESDVDFGADE